MTLQLPTETDPPMTADAEPKATSAAAPRVSAGAARRWVAGLSPRNVGAIYVLAIIIIVFSFWVPETFPTVATLKQVLDSNAITAMAPRPRRPAVGPDVRPVLRVHDDAVRLRRRALRRQQPHERRARLLPRRRCRIAHRSHQRLRRRGHEDRLVHRHTRDWFSGASLHHLFHQRHHDQRRAADRLVLEVRAERRERHHLPGVLRDR